MKEITKSFKYVDYLWDEQKSLALRDNQVDLFVYRSNILGTNLRITNNGGVLDKSTGNMINVGGRMANAFVRYNLLI